MPFFRIAIFCTQKLKSINQGTSFETKLIGTGFGGFLVNPLMERLLEELGDVLPTRAQAEAIMERALKVLYYRDKSTYNNWSIGFAEKVIFLNFETK